MARITVKGLSSLQAKLKKLEPLTHDALYRGVHAAGLNVEGAAKNIVPVSTPRTRPGGPHGELRDSISTNTEKTFNGAKATVGTNKEYALYVEMGTSKMRAQPYLQPSLQKNKKNARKLIMTEIVKAHRSL